jgi:hypothetical protein
MEEAADMDDVDMAAEEGEVGNGPGLILPAPPLPSSPWRPPAWPTRDEEEEEEMESEEEVEVLEGEEVWPKCETARRIFLNGHECGVNLESVEGWWISWINSD